MQYSNPIPTAPNRPQVLTTHEDSRVDPWFWLRDLDDPATLEYIRAENDYTQSVMRPTERLQGNLYTEMRGRIKEDDSTVPEKEGDYYYYTRHDNGKQYPIHCRKHLSMDDPEEVLIDVNELAKDKEYCQVGRWENSPDHNWLAYSVDEDGSEQFTIFIKNIKTGELLIESIPNSYYSLEWANDSRTLFYDVLDENHRPVKILMHRLGDVPAEDKVIYEELDERFFVHLVKSASKQFIYVVASGNNMSEWHFMEADSPTNGLKLIQPRHLDFEYEVVDHGNRFQIRHNGSDAMDFKISETLISKPTWENWKDLIPHMSGRPIGEITVFQNHLVLCYRTLGLPKIWIMEFSTGKAHEIVFQEEDYAVDIKEGREWNTSQLRIIYSSLTTPATVFDYDMDTRKWELRKKTEVIGQFSPEDYYALRILAPTVDGVKVPISLLYAKGTPLDGTAPLYLYAYGSYGLVIDSYFSSARLSLLDRGFIFAVAHVRGGMDLGWDWYEDGKLLRKQNTFNDFISCAEHLIHAGYTARGRIVASGGSAGGMLMGVVANLRPDLFKAVIAEVPFVDVLNTMLDDTLPLTAMEYNEWGNPKEKQFYDYIKSYSPYDNVKRQDYPHMLITGGLNDPRVTFWEPAKWTARLRYAKTDDNLLLLKIHMDSGHAGSSGRFDRLKEIALEYAFITKVFEVN